MKDREMALRLVRNIVRVGRVNSVNQNEGSVQVLFPDRDNLISNDLPVMDFAPMPKVNDQVLCIFLGNAIEDGFCLGTFRTS